MSNQDKENRIIEKVKKLFALAGNDGATGAESENAMRMANALLSKYSLEMSQLTGTDESVFCTWAEYNLKTPGTKSIIGSIGRLYNCRVIFDMNWTPAKTLIIGSGANRMTATIVIDQILDQVKRETRGEVASYKHGVAIGLNDVCKKIIAERKADRTEILPGTGLMPIDQMTQQANAADDFVSANFAGLKSSRSGKGSLEGRNHGNRLNPGARVGGEGQRRLS